MSYIKSKFSDAYSLFIQKPLEPLMLAEGEKEGMPLNYLLYEKGYSMVCPYCEEKGVYSLLEWNMLTYYFDCWCCGQHWVETGIKRGGFNLYEETVKFR